MTEPDPVPASTVLTEPGVDMIAAAPTVAGIVATVVGVVSLVTMAVFLVPFLIGGAL